MRRALLVAVLVLMPALAGCALLKRGPGDETLVVSNRSQQPINMILRIATFEGGIPIFGQEILLEVGQTRQFALDLPPGVYKTTVAVTNGLNEVLALEIPDKGDSKIELLVYNRQASLTVSSY